MPYYILAFAAGNVLGPLLLGPLFDRIGRRAMITFTYGAAGTCLLVTAILFQQGVLTAFWQTFAWTVIFFFASAGASSAYLTVSEVFPLEIRAMAIAFFYAIATAIGDISRPLLFGYFVGTKSMTLTMVGFLIGAVWLLLAALTELVLGVEAAQRPLEDVAEPLAAEDADREGERPERDRPGTARRAGYARRLSSPRPAFATGLAGGARHPPRLGGRADRAGGLVRGPTARALGARPARARLVLGPRPLPAGAARSARRGEDPALGSQCVRRPGTGSRGTPRRLAGFSAGRGRRRRRRRRGRR